MSIVYDVISGIGNHYQTYLFNSISEEKYFYLTVVFHGVCQTSTVINWLIKKKCSFILRMIKLNRI